MPDLREAEISKQQLLAVWSTNPDTGFTPAQLLAAGISIAEMQSNNITLSQIHAGGVSITHLLDTGLSITQLRTGGVPDYALFNEACNPQLSNGAPPGPTIKLLSTNLEPTNTQVVLEATAANSMIITWTGSPNPALQFLRLVDTPPTSAMREGIEAFYLRDEGTTLVTTVHIPLTRVFSSTNFTVFIEEGPAINSLQLCSDSTSR